MSSNLVIVALPADDDPVWKVSSEKKPHMTLLFLGDAESNPNVARITQFVWHAINFSEHGPFYMDVDHRGILGEDKADALHFRKNWCFRWVNQLRNQLLQNSDIRAAYDSTEQFPEWRPHLTLGYPETPAREDKMPEYGINSVRFDRIAVWTGNYEGPWFRLEWPDRETDTEMVYSATGKTAVEELLHVGVKGMRWGERKTEVRQDVNGGGRLVTPRKIAKLDKKFEKDVTSVATWVKVHNRAAEHINGEIPKINATFEKKYPKESQDGTLLNESHPITREYAKAYNREFITGLNKAAGELGTNASGTRRVKIVTEKDDSFSEFGWAIQPTDKVKHAAEDEDILVFVVKRDDAGFITHVELQDEELAQAMKLGEGFIEHYGVKGMRWGVRKPPPEAVAPTAVSKVPQGNKRKTRIEVEGGQNQPAAEDAIKVAQARAKLAKSGPAALSNKELQEIANRVELEQRVKRVTQPGSQKFVSNLLRQQGQQSASQFVGRKVKEKLA